ncbi:MULTISPECIES: hypothetical protein [unclassified Paenibacillus]|uniref:hypothetical protein n=1 Tax=unclassified Paenibacillus TaxID=185978 RepID=UPI001AE56487|nr:MULTISPECIES: hypothetical protein [unclassified Paenibacillus]MBP1154649.1 hypothetical protein [Paenibacillus sp. PvP091]MBP1169967.1 hypothetical protein [Paenibacillus sp. PvR098]MBP2440995.1 hypothetical protein [Paenibacillus sp. PvP052]
MAFMPYAYPYGPYPLTTYSVPYPSYYPGAMGVHPYGGYYGGYHPGWPGVHGIHGTHGVHGAHR